MREVGVSHELAGEARPKSRSFPRLERLSLGGVPAFWIETPPPYSAGLIFRVGRADETLATSGLTHLVEHLAIFGVDERLRGAVHGHVALTETHFYARGDKEDVQLALSRIASVLGDPPIHRLDAEKRILHAEAQGLDFGIIPYLLSLRFGAAGYGLAGWPEYGLSQVGAEDVHRWTRERFTHQNASVWLTGPSPLRLDLELPSGRRFEPPPLSQLEAVKSPAHVAAGSGWIAASLLVRRSMSSRIAATIITNRLRQQLRVESSASYSVMESYEAVTRDQASTVFLADVLDSAVTDATRVFADIVCDFAEGEVHESELDDFRIDLERALVDSAYVPSLARSRAAGELTGEADWSPATLVADAAEVTSDDVRRAISDAFGSMLIVVPEGQAVDRLPLLRPPTAVPVTGRAHRRNMISRTRLVVGNDGVTLVENGSPFTTVLFADCAALVRLPDGVRVLIGSDGQWIQFSWIEYRSGSRIISEIESRLPPHVIVDVAGDERRREVEDAVARCLTRRWVVFGELEALGDYLDRGEKIITMAEATRRLRGGVLLVTDRRLLFVASGLRGTDRPQLDLNAARTDIAIVRAFQSLTGGRLTIRANGRTYRFKEIEPRKRLAEFRELLAGS
jgi:zinc protease